MQRFFPSPSLLKRLSSSPTIKHDAFFVQVIELVSPTSPPEHVVLSDGFHYIKAILEPPTPESHSLQQCQTWTRVMSDKKLIGCLLLVKAYLFKKHAEPAPPEFTTANKVKAVGAFHLVVQDFEIWGFEGRPKVGQPIYCCATEIALTIIEQEVLKCRQLRIEYSNKQQQRQEEEEEVVDKERVEQWPGPQLQELLQNLRFMECGF